MYKELIFEGDHYQIGLKHGKALKREIHVSLKNYIGMWALPLDEISSKVKGFKQKIKEEAPHLAQEISGISYGSNIDLDLIYAINSRTELLTGTNKECTSIGVPSSIQKEGHTILAQNWDWYSQSKNLTRIVELRPVNKQRIKMLIEPGMIGKIGLNESGLGVCMNFLKAKKVKENGVPVHIILRRILECEDFSSIQKYLSNIERAASTNYLVGDDTGRICSFETSPEDVGLLLPKPFVSHTNSYTAKGENCLRYNKFNSKVSKHLENSIDNKISIEEINEALMSAGFFESTKLEKSIFLGIKKIIEKTNQSYNIKKLCDRFNLSYAHLVYGRSETIKKINLDLTKRSMFISDGSKQDQFREYSL